VSAATSDPIAELLAAPPPAVTPTTERQRQLLDRAEEIVEAEGLEALSMRRLAEAVGIRAPSLYKHVTDKADLEAMLQERALLATGAALRHAGLDAVAMGRAYRAWALAHPGLYALATTRPLGRDRIAPGVEDWSAAPVVAVAGGDEHLARALWAAAHGLVALELADRFPPGADLESAWEAVAHGLTSPAGADRP
jgi:AcrR family transcriptional regulator